MKLKYGTTTFEIHPAFAPTVNYKSEEGGNEPATIEDVWDIEGSFRGDGWNALITQWENMMEKLRVPAQYFAILDEADSVVYELDPDDCISGPTCTIQNVTEKRRAFLVTNILFSISIRAEYKNPEIPDIADLRGKVRFSFRFDSLGFMTISERGTAKGTNITKPPKPWLSPSSTSFRLDSSFDLSKNKTECSYTYKWVERRVKLPAGEISDLVDEFSLSIDENPAEDNLYNTIRVSGDCRIKRTDTTKEIWNKTGLFAKHPGSKLYVAEASDFIPVETLEEISGDIATVKEWIENHLIGSGVKILSKKFRVDAYRLRLSFDFQLIKPALKIARYDYSVSIKEKTVRTNVVPIYGKTPVIQYLSYSQSEITERGTVAYFDERPPHPAPFWPDYCTGRNVDYPKPTADVDIEGVIFPISFSFTYQKDEFGYSDLLDLVLERTGYMLPVAFFG